MIQVLWHYTKGLRMPSILADGVIKPSTLHVLEHQRIVWFSRDHIWERTVFCLDTRDGASMQTLAERYGGLFRIAVEPSTAPYTWKDLKRMARMDSKTVNVLVKSAKEVYSDPRNWRGTFEPVPKSLWIAIETWDSQPSAKWGGMWIPAPGTERQERR